MSLTKATYSMTQGAPVSVLDFGAYNDGTNAAATRAAIQAAFDYVAAIQNPQVATLKFTVGSVYFPQGVYLIDDEINCRGFVSINGAGVGGYASSTIIQTVANKNIFNFYGDTSSNANCSFGVYDLCFGFTNTAHTALGYALNFPRTNDIGGAIISSNSHYIKNNRFNGLYADGRCIYMATCNDVEITGNCFDVVNAPALVFGDQTFAGPTDVRICQNNFYACQVGVQIHSGHSVTIHGNTFSNQFNGAGWVGINLVSNTGTITPGWVTNITITSNSFWKQRNCIGFDESATNILVADNQMWQCWDTPLRGPSGAVDAQLWTISSNRVQFEASYTGTAGLIGLVGSGKLNSSFITDNSIDANGVATINSVVNDYGTYSGLGANNVYRNNLIIKNTSYLGAHKAFLPVGVKELVIESSVTTLSTTLPCVQTHFTFSTIGVGDYVTFELAWEAIIDKVAVNSSVRTGTSMVSIARLGGALAYDVTVVSSIATDQFAVGATALPDVTWAVSGDNLTVSVTNGGGIVAPVDVVVRSKAFNFRANSSSTLAIKSA